MSHLYETPYLDLVDPEPEVCYDDVFHVTIPSEWKVNDIKDDLYPHSITISWINDTSCFVRLTDKAQVPLSPNLRPRPLINLIFYRWTPSRSPSLEIISSVK